MRRRKTFAKRDSRLRRAFLMRIKSRGDSPRVARNWDESSSRLPSTGTTRITKRGGVWIYESSLARGTRLIDSVWSGGDASHTECTFYRRESTAFHRNDLHLFFSLSFRAIPSPPSLIVISISTWHSAFRPSFAVRVPAGTARHRAKQGLTFRGMKYVDARGSRSGLD